VLDLLSRPPLNACVEIAALRTRRARAPRRLRQAAALIRGAASGLPAKTLFDAAPGRVARLARLVAAPGADLVVINGGELFSLARHLPAGQAALALAHNVEASLYAAQTARARQTPLTGVWLARDLARLERTEREGLARMGRALCLSAEDAETLRALVPGLAALAQPTTFAYPPHANRLPRSQARPLRLGLLAKYGWWPNAEAAEWMIGEVMPRLPPGAAELHLFGRGAERFAGLRKDVIARGFAPDLAEVWEDSDIVVCPMRSGSGINVKLAEALYNGQPVLSTPVGLRGLPEIDDPAVVRCDGAESWAAFLSGPAADALASSQPRAATRAIFDPEAAAARLAAFLYPEADR
jgi:hypothetical protein